MFVTAEGWHTGIALPAAPLRDRLRFLTQAFPRASYLWFGWGQRQYYMASHPTLCDALRALLPGPAALLVAPLATCPSGAVVGGKVFALAVVPAGFARLADYVRNSLVVPEAGVPVRLGPGPLPGSVFYASDLTYDAAHTCNTWTAAGLQSAGLPVSPEGVVFASQVVTMVRRLAGPGGCTRAERVGAAGVTRRPRQVAVV